MTVPFVDLKAQYDSIREEVDRAIAAVIADAAFIGTTGNRYVADFERDFGELIGLEHCIGCGNGTDSIEILLQAMGIGPGDEVIVPAHTWISTAEAVTTVGATPVFVDTVSGTYTMDPMRLEGRITSRTRAIIPVHLYGLPADMDPILEIARRRDLKVIEDCAQAVLARYRGRLVGTLADAASFSFFPGKNLGAYGDAGCMATSDRELAARARIIGQHGQPSKHEHLVEGRNSRLDGLQAAILSAKLPHLERWTALRQSHAERYGELLSDYDIALPVVPEHMTHVYHLYVIQSDRRDALRDALLAEGISCGVHYPRALTSLPVYAQRGWREADFPSATEAARRILSLPMYPEMDECAISLVANVIKEFGDRNA